MNDMTLTTPPAGITMADYSAIEDAVMETARGRWFLLEYARRQRAAETQRLSDAVDRLEGLISNAQAQQTPPPNETAAAVAERLSDIVWSMRERGVGDQFCAELEKQIDIIRTLRVEISNGHETTEPTDASAQLVLSPPPPLVRDILRLELRTDDPIVVASAPIDDDGAEPIARQPTELQEPPAAAPAAPLDARPAERDAGFSERDARPSERDAGLSERDLRLAALARLDALPLNEKLVLFC